MHVGECLCSTLLFFSQYPSCAISCWQSCIAQLPHILPFDTLPKSMFSMGENPLYAHALIYNTSDPTLDLPVDGFCRQKMRQIGLKKSLQ